jgi:hypothetical protein
MGSGRRLVGGVDDRHHEHPTTCVIESGGKVVEEGLVFTLQGHDQRTRVLRMQVVPPSRFRLGVALQVLAKRELGHRPSDCSAAG